MADGLTTAPAVVREAPPEPSPAPPPPRFPAGTLELPPGVIARLTRILQATPTAQDVLNTYIEARGETGPYTLHLPDVVLVPG